jgi:hypothetical protein
LHQFFIAALDQQHDDVFVDSLTFVDGQDAPVIVLDCFGLLEHVDDSVD